MNHNFFFKIFLFFWILVARSLPCSNFGSIVAPWHKLLVTDHLPLLPQRRLIFIGGVMVPPKGLPFSALLAARRLTEFWPVRHKENGGSLKYVDWTFLAQSPFSFT